MDTKVTNSKKKKPKTIHIDHRRMKHINEENILKCILISQILQHCPHSAVKSTNTKTNLSYK